MLAGGEADILMSGGRTQFVALKTRTPWLDINQERHHAYAGYEGMQVEAHVFSAALSCPGRARSSRLVAPAGDPFRLGLGGLNASR